MLQYLFLWRDRPPIMKLNRRHSKYYRSSYATPVKRQKNINCQIRIADWARDGAIPNKSCACVSAYCRSVRQNREARSGALSCRSVVGYGGGLRVIAIGPEDDAC